MIRFGLFAAVVWIAMNASPICPTRLQANDKRYEMGQHLKQFEAAWEKYQSPEGRKRAVFPLLRTIPFFFATQWGKGARQLDKARYALKSSKAPPEKVRWADSLWLQFTSRFWDTTPGQIPFTLEPFYKTTAGMPDNPVLQVGIRSKGGEGLHPGREFKIPDQTLKGSLEVKKLPPGDHVAVIEIYAGKKLLNQKKQLFSVAKDLNQRIKDLQSESNRFQKEKLSTDSATLELLTSIVVELSKGSTFETDYPASRLLKQAERLAEHLDAKKKYFGPTKTGEYWLQLATSKGLQVVRTWIPPQAKLKKPLPLVVALHGAGGSENLFFDAYGSGEIVRQCKQRGWILVAPRSPPISFTSPVKAIVDEMARLYPVDRDHIFLVGHSMGAAQAISAAQQNPGYISGLAALGGSGKIRSPKKIQSIPFFVGVGKRDFALEGARRLVANLKRSDVKTLVHREYEHVEHIMVVPEALPEVFRFFDKMAEDQN